MVKSCAYSLLNVSVRLASGEASGAEVLGLGGGDDIRAVNQAVHVLAESRNGSENELEVRRELGLVVCGWRKHNRSAN